jgi:hypothetical protein
VKAGIEKNCANDAIVTVHRAVGEAGNVPDEGDPQNPPAPIIPPVMTSPPGAAAVEQRSQGTRPGR